MRQTYLVSCDHALPAYRLVFGHIVVTQFGEMFSADVHPHGCGKDLASPEWAIRDLLISNGCTSINIHGILQEQAHG